MWRSIMAGIVLTTFCLFSLHGASAQEHVCRPSDLKEVEAAGLRLAPVLDLQSERSYPPSYFDGVSRAEFAHMVVKLLGWEAAAGHHGGTAPFSDLGRGNATVVSLLWQAGLVKGYPDGTFRPGEFITLPELKLVLARILRLSPAPSLQTADQLLLEGGVDTTLPCDREGPPKRPEVWLLLDRALSVPLSARFQVSPP